MRANAPVYFDGSSERLGHRLVRGLLGGVEGPDDVLERRRHPARLRPAPDDDRHGRPGALEAAQAREPGLHAAAGCATARSRSATSCDEIIDAVCEQGECDFVHDIAAPLPMIMIGDMLGVAPEDRDDLLRWSDDMVSVAERQRDRGAARRGR